MAQQQQAVEQPKRRVKRAAKSDLTFDPSTVFGLEPAEDLELDVETSRFKAVKGQGGDRRT